MNQAIECENFNDENGNPAGGRVKGVGIHIFWQNGPLGRGEERSKPNGAFVEGVINAAMQRIDYYQKACGGKFMCPENALAAKLLEEALYWLDYRTKDREKRGVEGTHKT